MASEDERPKITCLGMIAIALILGACLGGAFYLLMQDRPMPGYHTQDSVAPPVPEVHGSTGKSGDLSAEVTIGIAYGTEKKNWLEWALNAFEQTPEGRRIKVELIPKGSLEGAQAVLGGDRSIHVWSPASALYKDNFVQEWKVRYGNNAILREEALALSPMVFVMWEERYLAFIEKFKTLNFKTIVEALKEKRGWLGIAEKPEWGLFKFGHTHPNQSNSGLMSLVLMAYHYHNKSADLTLKDILDADFQNWINELQRAVSGLSHSSGTMMREMVLKGPSAFDVLFTYENLTIDYFKNAQGRWGTLRVIYPDKNMWNDNPYYIVDAPWSTKEHRKAAEKFLEFLMRVAVQENALELGFRPGNPQVAIKNPQSPFVRYEPFGIRIELPVVCDPPKAEVLHNLLESWQRNHGGRR